MKTTFFKTALLVWVFLIGFSAYSQGPLAAGEASVLFLEGEVGVRPVDKDAWVEAYEGMSLSKGDTIRTGPLSWIEIALEDELKNIIRIEENTEIALTEIFPIRLNLLNGHTRSLIEKLDKGSAFQMRTPTAVCGVRGSGVDTKTNGKETTVSAHEKDAFVKGINVDGSVMADEIIVKEGFKAVVAKFKKPSEPTGLSAGERAKWNSWKGDLQGRLAGAAGTGKAIDTKGKMLEKRRVNKIEKEDKEDIERRLPKPPKSGWH